MLEEEFEILALEGFDVLEVRIRGLLGGCRGEVGDDFEGEVVMDLRGDVFGDECLDD